MILRFLVGFLFTYLLIHYLQKAVSVLYNTHILYSYSYWYSISTFTIPEMESERYICRLIWSIYFILYYYSINLKCFTHKNWNISHFSLSCRNNLWVRLNYATTHHHPPPAKICPLPLTTSQNISTATHHHLPPAKIYPPPPTTSQYISTTAYHFPKNGPPPRKSQNILIYNLFRYCFNSFFFFEMQYSFPWRFCVIKFWSVRFSNSKFSLHS